MLGAASALAATFASCRYEPAANGPAGPERAVPVRVTPVVGAFEAIELPAGAGAGQPFVAPSGRDGAVVSWLEPAANDRHALKLARIRRGIAGEAQTVAVRDDFFVNFADFPSVIDANGVLFAHWLQKRGAGRYAYDVRIATSSDDGRSWSDSIVVHDDGVASEHGFVSLVPVPGTTRAGAAWLDGRHMTGDGEGHDHAGGAMTLRYAEIDATLAVSASAEIDSRTCECCTTAIAMTAKGPLVAYRDRSAGEVRDIAIARVESGAWRETPFVADGWKIHGCPVNGPQADARGESVAIAWYTLADDRPRVRLAFSADSGAAFGPALDVAASGAAGYVDVAFVADGRVAVTWIEDDGSRAHLRMREVLADGTMLPALTIATTTRGRTGFPRIAVAGDWLLVAWNEKGDSPGIHVARAPVAR